MEQARVSPFRAPRVAPRWVHALEAIDRVLREKPEVRKQLEAVITDALAGQDLASLSAEQWLRALLVQQASRYDESWMEFCLNDSRACRAFCGLVDVYIPNPTIRANLRQLDEATWREIEPVLRSHVGRAWRKQYRTRVIG